MSDILTIDAGVVKAIGGLLITAIGSLVTATVFLVRRAQVLVELEEKVLGDEAKKRKGLYRIVMGDAENGEPGLVSLVPAVKQNTLVVEGIVRGFDVIDERSSEAIAMHVRDRLSVASPHDPPTERIPTGRFKR